MSTVVLIGVIAISRKFVILDIQTTSASTIAALAGALLVLGVVYWLLHASDDVVLFRPVPTEARFDESDVVRLLEITEQPVHVDDEAA